MLQVIRLELPTALAAAFAGGAGVVTYADPGCAPVAGHAGSAQQRAGGAERSVAAASRVVKMHGASPTVIECLLEGWPGRAPAPAMLQAILHDGLSATASTSRRSCRAHENPACRVHRISGRTERLPGARCLPVGNENGHAQHRHPRRQRQVLRAARRVHRMTPGLPGGHAQNEQNVGGAAASQVANGNVPLPVL